MINPKNNDGKCFQYAITVALNHVHIVKHTWRISKVEPFRGNCNWKEISFPSHKRDWKKFESYNNSTALIALVAENDKEEIKQAHISEHILNSENNSLNDYG